VKKNLTMYSNNKRPNTDVESILFWLKELEKKVNKAFKK
jgi:hypothetical protein